MPVQGGDQGRIDRLYSEERQERREPRFVGGDEMLVPCVLQPFGDGRRHRSGDRFMARPIGRVGRLPGIDQGDGDIGDHVPVVERPLREIDGIEDRKQCHDGRRQMAPRF
jgi:hypothetical protein